MIYDLSDNTDKHKAKLRFEEYLEKGYKIELKRRHKRRSINQNNLYWLWLTCISCETGNDKNDLHIYFMEEFLTVRYADVFDQEVAYMPRTSDLNKKEMSVYMNKIDIFCQTELNIKLPHPEDLGFEEFYNKYKYL